MLPTASAQPSIVQTCLLLVVAWPGRNGPLEHQLAAGTVGESKNMYLKTLNRPQTDRDRQTDRPKGLAQVIPPELRNSGVEIFRKIREFLLMHCRKS